MSCEALGNEDVSDDESARWLVRFIGKDFKGYIIGNEFWDKDAEERSYEMERACERGNCNNFFDLSPEERAEAYNQDEND